MFSAQCFKLELKDTITMSRFWIVEVCLRRRRRRSYPIRMKRDSARYRPLVYGSLEIASHLGVPTAFPADIS